MTKKFFWLAAFILAAGSLSGCWLGEKAAEKAGEKMVEKAIESQTGGQAKVDASDGSVKIKTDEGETEINTGGEASLPDGFPKELVITSDAKIVMSSSNAGGMSVSYETNEDQPGLYEKYKTQFITSGWKKEFEMDAGSAKMVNLSKGDNKANITIGENSSSEKNGQTMVNIIYTTDNKQPAQE